MQPTPVIAETPRRGPLYSVGAVRIFSILFSTVAGGALVAQNLRDVGQPAAARIALWSSLAYTALVMTLAFWLPNGGSGTWIGVATGYLGALGLEAYFRKMVPDGREGHPVKSVARPLLICVLIFGTFFGLLIYALRETGG